MPDAEPRPRAVSGTACCKQRSGCCAAGFGRPADMAVAAAQMTRRRTPCHAGDGPALRPHQILQVFAHRLLIAQVMMLFHEAVEQRLFGCSSDLLQRDRTEVGKRAGQRRHRRSAPAAVCLVRTNGFSETCRTAGSSISPARCSISRRPRQTMSRNAPLACFQSHASQSFADSLRRLRRGFCAMSCRMKTCLRL